MAKRNPKIDKQWDKLLGPRETPVNKKSEFFKQGMEHGIAGWDREGYGSRRKTAEYSAGYEAGQALRPKPEHKARYASPGPKITTKRPIQPPNQPSPPKPKKTLPSALKRPETNKLPVFSKLMKDTFGDHA